MGDAIADLVVVGEQVDDRQEAADFVEDRPTHGDGGAEGIARLLDLARQHDQGGEVGVHEQRLDESRQAAGVDGSIDTGHQARPTVLQRLDDAADPIRAHPNVAVRQDDYIVLGAPVHVVEIADFVVGAVHAVVDHQLDIQARELALQLPDGANGRVVGIGHAEEELERCAVALLTEGGQVFV